MIEYTRYALDRRSDYEKVHLAASILNTINIKNERFIIAASVDA